MTERNYSKRIKLLVALLVMVSMVLSGCGRKNAEEILDDQIQETSQYLVHEVRNPQAASIGGDWCVTGLARSGTSAADMMYFEIYSDNVRAKVKSSNGVIDEEYVSAYARTVIGLCSAGKDPKDVEGYNLVTPLDNYDEVTEQGVNAAAYALVASNVSGVRLTNEDRYIEYIIANKDDMISSKDGYISDYVSMAILGLSFYEDRDDVKKAIKDYVGILSEMQKEDGGFGNCESDSEAIVALTSVGINPFKDKDFTKKDTLANSLMRYRADDGAFNHKLKDKKSDLMATEKALIAMDALKCMKDGKKLYESEL